MNKITKKNKIAQKSKNLKEYKENINLNISTNKNSNCRDCDFPYALRRNSLNKLLNNTQAYNKNTKTRMIEKCRGVHCTSVLRRTIHENTGITLIALIITIIILLILSGITIASLTGSGLFDKAQKAKISTKIAEIKEKLELEKVNYKIENIDENITVEKYLNYIINQKIIDKNNIEDDNIEDSKIIKVEDKYLFQVKQKENDIEIKYIEKREDLIILAQTIALNTKKLELETYVENSTTTLIATISPENVTKKEVLWESSDSNIVTVDEHGNVTAKNVGTAIITVTANDETKKKDTCNVTVNITKLEPGETAQRTEKDNYEQGGKVATIPVGFTISKASGEYSIEDGLVIYEIPANKLANIDWYTTSGVESIKENYNQYVWIPCTEDGANSSVKYDRYAFLSSQKENGTDTETNSKKIMTDVANNYYCRETKRTDEVNSIKEYNGYYIGRYEAGIASSNERDSANISVNWSTIQETSGKPLFQKNKNVYNFITNEQAKGLAENLYNKTENGVTSKLCSSYAWDTALKFIAIKNSSYVTNSSGGNYSVAAGGTGKLAKTGYEKIPKCNIYDMGGNVYEWTRENNTRSGLPGVLRGGHFAKNSDCSAAFRNENSVDLANIYTCFRVSLFVTI